MEWISRTELLLGSEGIERIAQCRILLVGVGGVGAYAGEMLVRSGVQHLTIVDADTVQPSNINRQLVALHSTLNRPKVTVFAERALQINPAITIIPLQKYIDTDDIDLLLEQEKYDFIVDAIDTITPKIHLLKQALEHNTPIISSMGAGGRIDPSKITVSTLNKTHNCGLAKAVRTGMKEVHGSGKIPVVFSTELPDRRAIIPTEGERHKKSTVGTVSYLPAIFGCTIASYVIRKLTNRI